MTQNSIDTERGIVAVLAVLSNALYPIPATTLAQKLSDFGFPIDEQTAGDYLLLTDNLGLTHQTDEDGSRSITESGDQKLRAAYVGDKDGAIAKMIDMLSLRHSWRAPITQSTSGWRPYKW